VALSRSRRPRLLALRALGLGDFLTGVPALRALRRARPDHELVLAAPRVLAPLVELAGAVDRLVDARGLEDLAWSGPPPELAVNLHGCGPQSHVLLRSLRPGRLVAFGCQAARHQGPVWEGEEHETRRWCRLVGEALGVGTDPHDLRLTPSATAQNAPGAVVVHPGAAHPARRWPPDRFADVARVLSESGHDVVVTGGPGEVALARRVARQAGLSPDAVLAGRTDLAALAAEVSSARLVVCGDTGVAHLASAFGTPSVLLFGPMPPSRWGPPLDGPHEVVWHGTGTGDPWADEVDPALLRIGVDEVLGRALSLLSRSAAAPRTTPTSA
jgi:ADP-heptose:LPS heptosyltransferase